MLKKQEKGRSMIEMLGVLAVIGVLSVGGVYGYTTAMNKHRANELLNEASKRAVVCVAQIEAGNTPSVSDFGDYDGYTFTAAANPSNANQFQLTISGKDIPEAVCKNMKNTVGSSTPIRNINAGCTVITYNNDMGTTVYNSDYNGDPDNCPGKYCTGSNTCVDTGADCTCSGTTPTCKVCDTATGSYTDAPDDTPCVTAGNKDGTCQSGSCVATPTDNCPTGTTVDPNYTGTDALGDGKCICNDHTTAQCGLGYYCKFDTGTTCHVSGTGTCTEITSSETSHNYSSDPMNWWSAYSFCKGLNSTMVTGRTGSSVQCGTLSDYGSCSSQPSSRPGYYWLDTCTDNENTACSSSSCTAFLVDYGYVSIDDRNFRDDGLLFALCE